MTLPVPHPPAWPAGTSASFRWHPAWAIEVENWANGRISLHRRDQDTVTLGRVVRPARQFEWNKGFYAAAYLPGGTVVVCSRKVLRVRAQGPIATPEQVAVVRRSQQGVPLVNLLPRDWELGFESPAERQAILRAETHLFTNCAGDLFAQWAPPAGSPVFFHDGMQWKPLGESPAVRSSSVPRHLLLVAIRPNRWPNYLELENWTASTLEAWRSRGGPAGPVPPDLPIQDGRVFVAWNASGSEVTIVGSVYQRVTGVGRFDDTGMQGPGRICTNHPGDLAITTGPGLTAPMGSLHSEKERHLLEGFQIIPLRHAWHGVMVNGGGSYAVGGAPWLIVGPHRRKPLRRPLREFLAAGAANASGGLEGTAPLFSGYLSPRSAPGEEQSGATRGPGYVIRISEDFGRSWQPVPTRPGRYVETRERGLLAVTHVRIYLPTTPD